MTKLHTLLDVFLLVLVLTPAPSGDPQSQQRPPVHPPYNKQKGIAEWLIHASQEELTALLPKPFDQFDL